MLYFGQVKWVPVCEQIFQRQQLEEVRGSVVGLVTAPVWETTVL